jgi:hypothetical protein
VDNNLQTMRNEARKGLSAYVTPILPINVPK